MLKNDRYIFLIIFYIFPFVIFAQTNSFSVRPAPFSTLVNNEFSPVYYKNGIVFCSNLKDNSMVTYQHEGDNLFNLFYTGKKDNNNWKKPEILSDNLTTQLNDGPATFNKAGDLIYFCRNNVIDKKLKDINDTANKLGIYYAELVNDEWTNVKPFVHNNADYFFLTPALTPDGNRLYFASDMPGSFGGTDLYYCDRIENSWSAPVNLGPSVNTPRNETFPFACESGILFFASEGHDGFGGKDIFYTQEFNGSWITPVHLGKDINSSKDDFGLVTDADFQSGYFSTNRRRSDDIYSFSRDLIQFGDCVEQKENSFCFLFFDEQVSINDTISTRYEWDFSTGEKITGEKIKHCFPGPGEYSVTLRVINRNTGDTLNIPAPYTFELKNIEQAYIDCEDEGYTGDTINFNGLNSNLPGFKINDYHWDFGEGFTKHGPSVKYSFDKKGEYLVKLGITGEKDSLGAMQKVCVYKRIEIRNKKGK